MLKLAWLYFVLLFTGIASAQMPDDWLSDLPKSHDYILKRSSSYDRSGGNADARPVLPGGTIIVMDETGPGQISHIWFTIADKEQYHLKKIVIRMY